MTLPLQRYATCTWKTVFFVSIVFLLSSLINRIVRRILANVWPGTQTKHLVFNNLKGMQLHG